MGYTYSGDPGASPKDAVRYLARATGTDKATGFTSDEEIAWILKQEPNIYLAAAQVAEGISSFYGSQKTKTVGPLTISGREQALSYADLARNLRRRAGSASAGGPEFTGNTTVIFDIGMHDSPPGLPPQESLLGDTP